jgi:hypothetical protein
MPEPHEGSTMQDRIEELEARLARMERGRRSMTARSRSLMSRVVPPEASTHFRAASREQLLGMRALVDHWIRRLDEGDDLPPALEREDIPID